VQEPRRGILEDAVIPFGGGAKTPWRHSSRPMECSHEIGQVAEPDIECHLGNRPGVFGQQAGRPAQPGADQVLMRGHAEDFCEKPQKMERTEPELRGGALEVDRLARVCVDPSRRLHRAAAVAWAGLP